jgi:fructose-1,6-bisphosphatase II / sedoheptulose-1,7-bisphosphatase
MNLDKNLVHGFTRATERGAYGASLLKGKNNKIAADQAAVDEMRKQLNKIAMKGEIVIGEGELDEAPMLYNGEKVGNNSGDEIDIAVDPLEGTNFTAKNLPNAISVIAASLKGNLLKAPETYMEKIAVGSNLPKNLIDLDNSIEKNIKLLSDAKNTLPKNLTACILKRPRHDAIIKSLKSLDVKIKFIDDGDVLGVLSVSDPFSNVDIYLGIGGGPEGVLAAAALKCLNCQMQTRLVFQNEQEKIKSKNMGIEDLNRKYYIEDMIKGDVIFCASGVTSGYLLTGIKNYNDYFEAESLVLHNSTNLYKKVINKIKK